MFKKSLQAKLLTIGLVMTIVPLFSVGVVNYIQNRKMQRIANQAALELVNEDLDHVVQTVHAMCQAQQELLEQNAEKALNVARDQMKRIGDVSFSDKMVKWNAINQYTKQSHLIELPEMEIGGTWLGQSRSFQTKVPLVDKVGELLGGETCTVFQRMNERGDMLRVTTNVKKLDSTRAIGTYIPAINPDGKPNPVLKKILNGETFIGRAFVVNAWYITAYEPILNQEDKIVGVLYTGVPQESAESLRKAIMDIRIGDTGYVFVIDSEGKYVISKDGKRDGELIVNAKDTNGKAFIRELLQKAVRLRRNEIGEATYFWKNYDDSHAQKKVVHTTYFAPWDWVIGVGINYNEIRKTENQISDIVAKANWAILLISAISLAICGLLWFFISTGFSKRIVQLIDVLKRKNVKLEAMNRDVKMANQAKTDFLANMSHEIRTPMTAILGFSEILIENTTDKNQLDAATTVKQNGDYLLGIINDILDLSKIEADKMKVEQIPCSPCQIVSEVASLIRVRAKVKNLHLEVEYKCPIPQTILSDPTRLRQILVNLVGNAIKFTEIGKVWIVVRLIDAESQNPKIQFEVNDTGIGICEEQVNRLFSPFQQADSSTTRKFGGTGLGLTISKRLAEMLGGDIEVESQPYVGSTFRLTIATGSLENVPMLLTSGEAMAEKQTNTEAMPRSSGQLNCRILLVEDGIDNQRLISFILKKAKADVTLAENGQVAFEKAMLTQTSGEPFDIILMDMQMPVMDGYVATSKLRQAGYSGPIIALTAHAMSTDRQKCLDAGCNDYMTKPIDRTHLISMVKKYAIEKDPLGSPQNPDYSVTT